jgi:hypothetical protein
MFEAQISACKTTYCLLEVGSAKIALSELSAAHL